MRRVVAPDAVDAPHLEHLVGARDWMNVPTANGIRAAATSAACADAVAPPAASAAAASSNSRRLVRGHDLLLSRIGRDVATRDPHATTAASEPRRPRCAAARSRRHSVADACSRSLRAPARSAPASRAAQRACGGIGQRRAGGAPRPGLLERSLRVEIRARGCRSGATTLSPLSCAGRVRRPRACAGGRGRGRAGVPKGRVPLHASSSYGMWAMRAPLARPEDERCRCACHD